MQHHTTIAFIIPVYNPQNGWHELLYNRFCEAILPFRKYSISLLIVNDGSTNSFFKQGLNELGIMLPEYQFAGQDMNLGKGAALRLGVQQAVADYYIYTDVDLPYTAGSMQAILEQITNGKKDIIIGSRNEQYYRNVNRFRAGLSKLLRFFIRKLLRIPFDDTQCGLKAFNNTGKEIFLSTTVNRYLFDMEFVMLASKNKNIRLDAVPVELRQGVTLSKIPFKIFIQEVKNFIYLLLK